MVKVLIFDYKKDDESLEEMFEEMFICYPEIDYHFFYKSKKKKSFLENQKSIEEKLLEQDVLLIHPEEDGIAVVVEYPKRFPNLKVAFFAPDITKYMNYGLPYFQQGNYQDIIDFVLSAEKK